MTKSATLPPREVKFLLCEDVRREESGKLLIAGFYPGEFVILHNPVADKSKKLVGVVQRLCFVFVASKGVGAFDARLIIESPDGGKPFDQIIGRVDLAEQKTATLAGIIQPFPVFAFGAHQVNLRIGKRDYKFAYEILIGRTSIEAKKSPVAKRRTQKIRVS